MPNKGDINPATGKPYAVNPATGVWDDTYWAQVVEPQLKSVYSNPVTDMLQSIMDDYSKKFEDYSRKTTEFDTKNPFTYDDFLAEEKIKAKQSLDPYYEQTLSDFLTGVNVQRSRSLEDERTVLTDIQSDVDRITGDEKLRLTDAIERSREGFADAGLYTSGARLRDQGREEAQTGKTLSDTLEKQQRAEKQVKTQTTRLGEDLALEERIKRRDLSREQSAQVENEAISEARRREDTQKYQKGEYTGPYPTIDPTAWQSGLSNILLGGA